MLNNVINNTIHIRNIWHFEIMLNNTVYFLIFIHNFRSFISDILSRVFVKGTLQLTHIAHQDVEMILSTPSGTLSHMEIVAVLYPVDNISDNGVVSNTIGITYCTTISIISYITKSESPCAQLLLLTSPRGHSSSA